MVNLDKKVLDIEDLNECPHCMGSKKATVDFYNPSDFHGHGQYETDCWCVEMGIDETPVKIRKVCTFPDGVYANALDLREPSYTWTYVVLALGALTILAHYFVVLPYLSSTYGI